MSFVDFLIAQFYQNEFMTAAVVAAPMTALIFTARQLPMRLWRLAQRQFTVDVGFNSDIPDYLAVQEFVGERIVAERFSRTFLYASETKWDQEACEQKVIHRGLTPGYGPHIGFWKGRLVWVNRVMQDGQQSEKFKERLTLTFLTRSRAMVKPELMPQLDVEREMLNHVAEHLRAFIQRNGKAPVSIAFVLIGGDEVGEEMSAHNWSPGNEDRSRFHCCSVASALLLKRALDG